jgi:hypothetical protein
VLAVVYKNEADEHTRGILKTSITQYYGSNTNRNAVTLSWDLVMSQVRYGISLLKNAAFFSLTLKFF